MANIGEEISNWAWYIIPGFIFFFLVLLPAPNHLIKMEWELVLLISWIIGFFIHQVYRVIYDRWIYQYKPVLNWYKKEFERECQIRKSKRHLSNLQKEEKERREITKLEADCYYEFRYWYKNPYENMLKGIKKLGAFEASMGTIELSLILSLFCLILFSIEYFSLDFIQNEAMFIRGILLNIVLLLLFALLWYAIFKFKNKKEKEFFHFHTYWRNDMEQEK